MAKNSKKWQKKAKKKQKRDKKGAKKCEEEAKNLNKNSASGGDRTKPENPKSPQFLKSIPYICPPPVVDFLAFGEQLSIKPQSSLEFPQFLTVFRASIETPLRLH